MCSYIFYVEKILVVLTKETELMLDNPTLDKTEYQLLRTLI